MIAMDNAQVCANLAHRLLYKCGPGLVAMLSHHEQLTFNYYKTQFLLVCVCVRVTKTVIGLHTRRSKTILTHEGHPSTKGAKDKVKCPKGRQLEVGARRAPRLLVLIYVPIEYLHCIKESPISYRHPKYHSLSRVMCHITPGHKM